MRDGCWEWGRCNSVDARSLSCALSNDDDESTTFERETGDFTGDVTDRFLDGDDRFGSFVASSIATFF